MEIFEGLWFELLYESQELGKIDWSEAAADAWLARAKGGGDGIGKTKCRKGPKVVDVVGSN